MSPAQEMEVKQKIRALTREMYLSCGDILKLAVGKFSRSYPVHVEEFFEWLGSRKWTDEDGKPVKTFDLLSDRSWLKPIVEQMFSVHIQYGIGQMGL